MRRVVYTAETSSTLSSSAPSSSRRRTTILLLVFAVVLLASLLFALGVPMLAGALIAGMAFVLLILASPFLGLMLALMLTLIGEPGSLFYGSGATLTLSRLIEVVVFAGASLALVATDRKIRPFGTGLGKSIVLFLGFIAINTLLAQDWGETLAPGGFYLLRFALYVLLVVYLVDLRHVTRAAWVLVGSVAVMSILALTARFAQSMGVMLPWASDHPRLHGFGYLGPNEFALFVVITLPIAFFLIPGTESRAARLLCFLALAAGIAGIVLSLSRATTLALVIAAALTAWKLRSRINLKVMLAGALLIPILLVLMPSAFEERMDTLSAAREGDKDESIKARFTYIIAGLHVLRDYPIIGVGPGNFAPVIASPKYSEHVYYAEHEKKVALERGSGGKKGRVAHNTYLETMVELGIPGFISFLIVLLLCWRNLILVRRDARGPNAARIISLSHGFEIALIVFLFNILFLSLGVKAPLLWILLAFSDALRNIAGPATEPATASRNTKPQPAPAATRDSTV